ncbi:receptor-type tyrosine-protein phosphatase [Thraustotheca clavata]|uniref:Receptor-type tyrosine-protein phosphatase n=1 Tax=Thraustotheca clavata TaxID=74557 RepID=A0A1V9ZSS3_9STRA|nr:receptor-type tyrosine-protein phosphatase [Thraustotheca clavata]
MAEWFKPMREALGHPELLQTAPFYAFFTLEANLARSPVTYKAELEAIQAKVDGQEAWRGPITRQTNATSRKNRYSDVLPYERTRVRLHGPPIDAAGDYINANYVCDKTYIACCAPPPSAIADFWSMIWFENTKVILMLTKFVERRVIKADFYWDAEGNVVQYGDVSVRLTSEETSGIGFIIRSFQVTHVPSDMSRTVYQVQLTTWPDHGVLNDFRAIQPMLRLVNALNAENLSPDTVAPPMVVHCSAGIGRSGTIIAIDYMLNKLREAFISQNEKCLSDSLDVRTVVQKLRCDRPGMVQTPDQLGMIYRYVRWFIETGAKF